MSINTADFVTLTLTVVLFAVIYYLDYKEGVDFGLLTLLGTVFGIAVGLGFKSFYICANFRTCLYKRINSTHCTNAVI